MVDWTRHVGRVVARLGEDYVLSLVDRTFLVVHGVFSSPFESSPLVDVGLESAKPTLVCMSADLMGNVKRATFPVGGVTYRVESVEPDVTDGSSRLLLSKI